MWIWVVILHHLETASYYPAISVTGTYYNRQEGFAVAGSGSVPERGPSKFVFLNGPVDEPYCSRLREELRSGGNPHGLRYLVDMEAGFRGVELTGNVGPLHATHERFELEVQHTLQEV
ncbi:hypothetical protein DSO57_1006939 [Entomophthora muscae]|uniref:Uncharacterized protein n=1 Tax=Entomophthora muscae TaxID=34485 RepID=A0ACC2SWR5_9FUNG|nr:hypothetical protein DSO57_1006939 [Entomophthora muscae]